MAGIKTIYVGEVISTNNCGNVVVLEKSTKQRVMVKFDDGTTVWVSAGNLVAGKVYNYNLPTVLGVAHMGYGEFSKASHEVAYKRWNLMLGRCYCPKRQELNPWYIGCTVCESWLCFQNFAKDFYSMKGHDIKGWHLDKDIVVKGNKEYSMSNCSMVPRDLNNLINNRKACRGEFPIGVSMLKGRFTAGGNFNGTHIWLGAHDTSQEAFNHYKSWKESLIKEQANKWRGLLCDSTYQALMDYEVEITD